MSEFQQLANIATLTEYVKNFGILAPIVAFGLFVIQAALPVFPYIILAAAGGILFGFKLGVLISWSGALFGACLAYWVCRLLGFDWAKRTLNKWFGYDVEQTNSGIAFWTIVITRIIPVVPTPLINAVAAVGGVSFWNFFFSSAIGKVPSAVLYTGLGLALFEVQDIKLVLLILGVILTLVVVGRYYAKDFLFGRSQV